MHGICIYPHSREYAHLPYWLCKECDAYVGCRKGTNTPAGTLANKKLRQLRIEAHKKFDAIWRSGKIARSDAYALLAKQMKISKEEAHIAMFSTEQCNRLINFEIERIANAIK